MNYKKEEEGTENPDFFALYKDLSVEHIVLLFYCELVIKMLTN